MLFVYTSSLMFALRFFAGPIVERTSPLGLLFAGLCVPALFMRLLPRWLAVSGLVLGAIGQLSALSLVIPGAFFLIPLTRFPGFLWLIAAGFTLPRTRSAAARAA